MIQNNFENRQTQNSYFTQEDQPMFDQVLEGYKRVIIREQALIEKYFSLPDGNRRPSYLENDNIFESHRTRCQKRIKEIESPQDWSYTKTFVTKDELCARKPLLAHTLSKSINEALSCPYDISTALNFFISMVCVVDDYIDQEDTFEIFGEKLFVISHAYMDLMDISLHETFKDCPQAHDYIKQIHEKIYMLENSLITSESRMTPDQTLQYKSSGSAIVDIFTPLARVNTKEINLCKEFVQLIGEIGQIIDDTVDLTQDSKNKKKGNNYLLLKGWSPFEAITEVKKRLQVVANLAILINNLPAWSIWKTYNSFADLIINNIQKGIKITPALLINVFPIPFAREMRKLSETSLYKLPIEMMLL